MLPESWHLHENLAAGVVGTNRWTAGERMLTSYGPEAWNRIAKAAELETANQEALDECKQDATRTAKLQRCTVQVSSSTRPAPMPGAGKAERR